MTEDLSRFEEIARGYDSDEIGDLEEHADDDDLRGCAGFEHFERVLREASARKVRPLKAFTASHAFHTDLGASFPVSVRASVWAGVRPCVCHHKVNPVVGV